MLYRSEPCRSRFLIFEKKVQIFPLKSKKLTRSHFVQKLAQIVGYGQTVIVEWTQEMLFNTYHDTKTCLDEKIETDEKKIFLFFFPTNFPKGHFKALPEKLFFEMNKI